MTERSGREPASLELEKVPPTPPPGRMRRCLWKDLLPGSSARTGTRLREKRDRRVEVVARDTSEIVFRLRRTTAEPSGGLDRAVSRLLRPRSCSRKKRNLESNRRLPNLLLTKPNGGWSSTGVEHPDEGRWLKSRRGHCPRCSRFRNRGGQSHCSGNSKIVHRRLTLSDP